MCTFIGPVSRGLEFQDHCLVYGLTVLDLDAKTGETAQQPKTFGKPGLRLTSLSSNG